jgi:hypothetical protein
VIRIAWRIADAASGHTSTLQDPVIAAIAEAHGMSPAQVMLRRGLQHGRSQDYAGAVRGGRPRGGKPDAARGPVMTIACSSSGFSA